VVWAINEGRKAAAAVSKYLATKKEARAPRERTLA
jgi:NADPH-dependent glutamate synthase beta subunit-like oxidoreductase